MSTQRYTVTPYPIETMLNGGTHDYDAFLNARRKLMAAKMQTYFQSL